jgi:hypothetical protein
MAIANSADHFAQFDAPDGSRMDVDLMFVAEDVFANWIAMRLKRKSRASPCGLYLCFISLH